MLQSIGHQLETPIAKDIIMNLEEAQSQYAQPFHRIREDITGAIDETTSILQFWEVMSPWFRRFHDCDDPKQQLKLIPPIIHTLMLVWQYSRCSVVLPS